MNVNKKNSIRWNLVAESGTNMIEKSGWMNSCDGMAFSNQEMDEYVMNCYTKLSPYLNEKATVLEVGCAAGITMYKISQYVQHYIGTDVSEKMIETNKEYIKTHDIKNISLLHAPANELSEHIKKESVDVVVINSVIQYFETTDYLEKVISDLMGILKHNGILFIGDVRDADKWEDYVIFLKNYHMNFEGGELDIEKKLRLASKELFLSKSYFEILKQRIPNIHSAEITDKIGTIQNELTQFRFDILMIKS